MLNNIMTNYYFTFRVIGGKANRIGFDIGFFLVREHFVTDKFNYCFTVSYSLKDK